jgi:hypothetical protein
MNTIVEFLIQWVNAAFDFAGYVFDQLNLLLAGGAAGLILAPTMGIVTGVISEGTLAIMRRWHGSIDEQYGNIDNLVLLLTKKKNTWDVPEILLTDITGLRDQLQRLITLCRGNSGTRADRDRRNAVLKAAVGLCLLEIKVWAYGQYTAGVILADEIHSLGFLLPGETGGHHNRTEPTEAIAEVKVKVINEDAIRVVIDQSAAKDAGPVLHGWPEGVKNALIVIIGVDGNAEVYRQLTSKLHTDIKMPAGSHGKQFAIKAAFLRHVNDEPHFGPAPTFSMPLSTEDLIALVDRQHHEDFEAQQREIERQRLEIERLRGKN